MRLYVFTDKKQMSTRLLLFTSCFWMWFQELLKMNLSSVMPECIRKVTWTTSLSLHPLKHNSTHTPLSSETHHYFFVCVCVCVFSVCWNHLLQSWECGVHLFPTWTSPPWAWPSWWRLPGSSTVGVKAHRQSSLIWYISIHFRTFSAI